MRDPARIYKFCFELASLWREKAPDWRFGQLMMNILGTMQSGGRDPFFPEEEEMLTFIKNYFDNLDAAQRVTYSTQGERS